MLCPSCGRENPQNAQFCNGCGGNLDTHLAEAPRPSEETAIPSFGSFVGRQREEHDN